MALTGWRWAVFKHMPQMSATIGAMLFGTGVKKHVISCKAKGLIIDGLEEARPACAAVEFVGHVEERMVTTSAVKDPRAFFIIERG